MSNFLSPVQLELDALRQKGNVQSQRHKISNSSMPITTPEQAEAFMAAMRSSSKKSGSMLQPPPHILSSGDGYDAWYMQQRALEREERKRRQEAEALLHGYRMRANPRNPDVDTDYRTESPAFDSAIIAINSGPLDADGWGADLEGDNSPDGPGKLNLADYFNATDEEYNVSNDNVGRLDIHLAQDFDQENGKEEPRRSNTLKVVQCTPHSDKAVSGISDSMNKNRDASANDFNKRNRQSLDDTLNAGDNEDGKENSGISDMTKKNKNTSANHLNKRNHQSLDNTLNAGDNEDGKENAHMLNLNKDIQLPHANSAETDPSMDAADHIVLEAPLTPSGRQRNKGKPVPTPALHLVPDETEWRDFISSEEGAAYPPDNGRYHLYASYADPGSQRCLMLRAIKGLNDVISVTIVHPTWQRTQLEDSNDGHRGWVFGDPHGKSFTNASGRGGPFLPAYPGNETDQIIGAKSIKDVYDHAGDNANKHTVPILWDKQLNTIVNNDSSDIAYMFNSRFNESAQNPESDLYTESDPEPLWDVDDWIQPLMINGFYRCGFAKTQQKYEKAITELTDAFDKADKTLQTKRFLTGNTMTDADVRLFCSLIRFDEVYAFYFKANTRLVMLTPALLNYCRDIYQMEGVAATCYMDHIKAHFFGSHPEWNKYSIIPRGMDFMNLLTGDHDRESLASLPKKEIESVSL